MEGGKKPTPNPQPLASKKTLLIGPAGSGKTHLMLEEFERALRESENPLKDDFFYLLPSAEHTERIISLIVQRKIKGFFHQRISTLSSLISKEFHVGDEGVATNVTRYLIVREILNQNKFDYFGEVQNTPGFLQIILGFITELKESLISASDFRKRINDVKPLEPDMAPKYEALASIYELYASELEARGLRDRQDNLEIYRSLQQTGNRGWGMGDGENISKKAQPSPTPYPPFPKFKHLWLDGFFDFTALQFEYLKELSNLSENMTLSLTYDEASNRQDLFAAVKPTVDRLLEMGFVVRHCERPKGARQSQTEIASDPALDRNGFDEQVPRNDGDGNSGTGSLDRVPLVFQHIEQNLFSSAKPKDLPKPTTELAIFEAVGIEGEVEMIARTIRHMTRSGDFRLSDFSILLRRIGDYESVIRSIFMRYEIPVEIHERERLSYSPLVQSIVKLLLIFKEGWKLNDLTDFLKSSYINWIPSQKAEEKTDHLFEWVHAFENEAKRRRVFEGREELLQVGTVPHGDSPLNLLAEIEKDLFEADTYQKFRDRFVKAVKKDFGIFKEELSTSIFVKRDAASFRRFEALLDEIERSMPETFERRGEAVPRPDEKNEKATQRIAPTDESNEIFNMFCERFFRLVDLDLYSLKNRDKNQVQVYDISLARQKEYKVVFVAGLLEKNFPVQIKEDPLLSDWERRLFNSVDEEKLVAERLPKQKMERYLFYLAVTRAKHKLILTYPRLNLEGKDALPSYYVREVTSLFSEEVEPYRQELSRPYPSISEAVSERELELGVMGELWRVPINRSPDGTNERATQRVAPTDEKKLLYLTNELLKNSESQKNIKQAFYEVKDEFSDPEILKSKNFLRTEMSATRLEEYAKCHFKYYAHRTLRLEDPEEDTYVMVRGTILHDVLENAFKLWAKDPIYLKHPEKAKKQALGLLEGALKNNRLIFEKRYIYELELEGMKTMLLEFLDAEFERLHFTSFKPGYFEFNFGGTTPDASPLEIQDGERTILVQGKIDRVDVTEAGEAHVIDYKRTALFKRLDVELGTALQLPIYLAAVKKHLGLQPAGAELYSLKEKKLSGFYHKDFISLFPKSYQTYRKDLVFENKEFEDVIERSFDFIRKFTREMEAMNIEVKPRNCESFCPYSGVCRIEKWKLPMIYEEIKKEQGVGDGE